MFFDHSAKLRQTDGPAPYRYASGDPLNRMDPDGRYAIDVHYMTYFLALTAGLDDKTAWVIATAAQTIDNVNPYTDALPQPTPWDADSAKARERYHFTQTSSAWDPLNPQVVRLLGYATKNDANPCLKAQFYGEFLHAYEDTFGHRDRNNVPYSTDGHGNDLTSPDKTYNHTALYFFNWNTNEARTLLAEQAVFDQIRFDWNVSGKDGNGNTITFASLQPFLEAWNKIQDDGVKIKELNKKLVELGFKAKIVDYDGGEGLACRLKYFQQAGLIGDNGKTTIKGITDYPDAILNTVTKGATTCKY